jgi:PAS domain-containing protein
MTGPNHSVPQTREGADSALLEALFAETPIGLAFWDTEFRYQRVNDVLAAINGRPVEEHLGRRVSEVLPELGPQLEELFAKVLATGEAQRDRHIAGETPAAPGVTRHWLASYFPVRADDGVPIGLAATVVETTGERDASARASRAERRNEAIDAQLRAVYSALPVGVAFVTPELRYERVNEALAQMNQVPAAEHLGRSVGEVTGQHDIERALREVVKTGEPLLDVDIALHGRQFEASYFAVRDDRGELLAVGKAMSDVTARRRAEAARERMQDATAALAGAVTELAGERARSAAERLGTTQAL